MNGRQEGMLPDIELLLSLYSDLRNESYSDCQFVPFADHTYSHCEAHLESLLRDEQEIIQAININEPVIYSYSLCREFYARRLNERQRLLCEMFLYNHTLPAELVKSKLSNFFDTAVQLSGSDKEIRIPFRIVPLFDEFLIADTLDSGQPDYVFLHNDSIRMARYLRSRDGLSSKIVADIGTGSDILAFASRASGAARVIGVDINDRAVKFARLNTRLNAANNIEIRSGSIELVLDEAEVIVSNPPYMQGRNAIALNGGSNGLDLPLKFIRQASERGCLVIMILETMNSQAVNLLLRCLGDATLTRHVLRRQGERELAVYEIAATENSCDSIQKK